MGSSLSFAEIMFIHHTSVWEKCQTQEKNRLLPAIPIALSVLHSLKHFVGADSIRPHKFAVSLPGAVLSYVDKKVPKEPTKERR